MELIILISLGRVMSGWIGNCKGCLLKEYTLYTSKAEGVSRKGHFKKPDKYSKVEYEGAKNNSKRQPERAGK